MGAEVAALGPGRHGKGAGRLDEDAQAGSVQVQHRYGGRLRTLPGILTCRSPGPFSPFSLHLCAFKALCKLKEMSRDTTVRPWPLGGVLQVS